ncbi:MAG TPA: NAD(P)-dependent oxidoreductase [Streptosporangiaceae bacterium]|jgi:nucleoside-diphosphate-sugar epimerase
MGRILITGSRGLIGEALARRLTGTGWEVARFDVADGLDVLDDQAVAAALADCDGVFHLAAVSRVVWGEQDPTACRSINVTGTRNVLTAAARMSRPPWVIVASSREVYGQAVSFPVPESADLRPLNAYAHTKVAAENLVAQSVAAGLRASVIRFSSVYGSVEDHGDRVVPAFARLAARGETLRIDGPDTTLDLTHVDDVVTALEAAVTKLATGPLPVIHLVSGRGTSLRDLADIAVQASGRGSARIVPPRTYDVSAFVGDPARAAHVLGWRTSITPEDGVPDLVNRFAAR